MHDMARIVITTFGSTGDLNPFVALGLALRSNGHDVLFAVEANFEQQVSRQPFSHVHGSGCLLRACA